MIIISIGVFFGLFGFGFGQCCSSSPMESFAMPHWGNCRLTSVGEFRQSPSVHPEEPAT
ncbi:hypothetical protein C1H46_032428 [Malus baccata]|uniref:Secreted protein n=1 Tax=Malus baccata TaxID=106549 RepID=A0A540L6Q8_MALBA|nr:hypothetical protein C1H46_032428 [Malus baccata]